MNGFLPELPSGSLQALTPDQFSGDVLCPLCGEPLEIRIGRTEYGAEPEGHCALCMTIVEIDL